MKILHGLRGQFDDWTMRSFTRDSFVVAAILLLVISGALGKQRVRDDVIGHSLSRMIQRFDVGRFQHPRAGQDGIHKTCYNYFIWCVRRPSAVVGVSVYRVCCS